MPTPARTNPGLPPRAARRCGNAGAPTVHRQRPRPLRLQRRECPAAARAAVAAVRCRRRTDTPAPAKPAPASAGEAEAGSSRFPPRRARRRRSRRSARCRRNIRCSPARQPLISQEGPWRERRVLRDPSRPVLAARGSQSVVRKPQERRRQLLHPEVIEAGRALALDRTRAKPRPWRRGHSSRDWRARRSRPTSARSCARPQPWGLILFKRNIGDPAASARADR